MGPARISYPPAGPRLLVTSLIAAGCSDPRVGMPQQRNTRSGYISLIVCARMRKNLSRPRMLRPTLERVTKPMMARETAPFGCSKVSGSCPPFCCRTHCGISSNRFCPLAARRTVDDRASRSRLSYRHPIRLRSGIPWQLLPKELSSGSGMTCWRRLRDWQRKASGIDALRAPELARARR